MTAPSKPQRAWIAARPPKRGGEPATLARVLADTQKVASGKSGAALSPDEWRRLVGDKIAARTRVGRLVREVLTVHVASSAWCNELSLLSPDILARLQRAGLDIHKLELRVSAFEEAAPAMRRTAPARKGPSRQTPNLPGHAPEANKAPEPVATQRGGVAPLPAALQARLAMIDDPELRAAIAEAAALSLASQR